MTKVRVKNLGAADLGMGEVGQNKKPSSEVSCPVCGEMKAARGLLAHVRLSHPSEVAAFRAGSARAKSPGPERASSGGIVVHEVVPFEDGREKEHEEDGRDDGAALEIEHEENDEEVVLAEDDRSAAEGESLWSSNEPFWPWDDFSKKEK